MTLGRVTLVSGLVIAILASSTHRSSLAYQAGEMTFGARAPERLIAGQDAKLEKGTSALSGVVVDASTGLGVPGALVFVARTTQGAPTTTAIADSQGRFVAVGLASGSYSVRASHVGYLESRYGLERPVSPYVESPFPSFALGESEWRGDLSIRLWGLSSVGGRVTDSRGEPLVGVPVRAYARVRIGASELLAGTAVSVTDDRGHYRIDSLTPGPYFVAVVGSQATVLASTPELETFAPLGSVYSGGPQLRGSPSLTGPALASDGENRLVVGPLGISPPDSDGRATWFQPLFYPSALTPSGSTPLQLKYGTHLSSVDFELAAVPTFRITGRVNPGQSGPVFLRLLSVDHQGAGLGAEVATTMGAPDGSFTFLGIPSGDYVISVQPDHAELVLGSGVPRVNNPAGLSDGGSGMATIAGALGARSFITRTSAAPMWGKRSITLSNRDLSGVDVDLQPLRKIHGRLEGDASARLPDGQRGFFVSADPSYTTPLLTRPSSDATPGQLPSTFVLAGLLPGVYHLKASHLPTATVSLGGIDVTDTGIDVTASDAQNVVVTVTGRTNELVGKAPSALVVVFPDDERLWLTQSLLPRRVRAVATRDGQYRFRNLLPGRYRIVALADDRDVNWAEVAFLRSAHRQSEVFEIGWGGRSSLDITKVMEVAK